MTVVDGDTLRAETPNGRPLGRVRLLGINAPEAAHAPEPADCYGDQATHELEALAPEGSRVTLVSDPTQNERDSYDRLLRYVELDGRDLNRQLLKLGAARVFASRPAITRSADYAETEQGAERAGIGLWGSC